MKKKHVCFLLLFFTLKLLASPDSLYRRANALYQEGLFESALATYKRIVDDGVESGDLYYNMGNAAFRSNNIGYAILYYEKALKLDPAHEDATHNLRYAMQYRLDAFEPVPEFFLRTWIKTVVRMIPERSWSMLSLFFFFMLIVSLVIYLFARRLTLKKAGFFSAIVMVMIFLLSLFSAINQYKNILQPESGIILSPSVVVKSTPSDSGTELFILHEGTRVKFNEEVSDWYNIRIIDGREGWIKSDEFGSI